MAPEQAGGQTKRAGPAADVYALGAVLYELLTGRPPFRGTTALETLDQVLHLEPVPPARLQPKVPRDLDVICLKCLQKDPRRRYDSAGALADDLRRFQSGEPIRARRTGRAERLWRWCRRNPVPASLLLAITLGAACGFWYLSVLSGRLVRSPALESAAQQSEMFDEVHNFYSAEVSDRAQRAGLKATAFFRRQPGTLPAPATFTIELGRHITAHSRFGMQVRLYSDAPFTFRKDGGPHDEFEREALARLRAQPDQPFYRFEDLGDRPVLRYATARRITASCLSCHNRDEDSPRHDWAVGDVRGVLEIIRPLDRDVARTRAGLREGFFLIGGTSGALLVLSSLLLFLGRRRHGPTAAPEK
jgi:hypothetical protein